MLPTKKRQEKEEITVDIINQIEEQARARSWKVQRFYDDDNMPCTAAIYVDSVDLANVIAIMSEFYCVLPTMFEVEGYSSKGIKVGADEIAVGYTTDVFCEQCEKDYPDGEDSPLVETD